jgi:ADP-ribose pyrophosphatase YjhB (NUDIX family)
MKNRPSVCCIKNNEILLLRYNYNGTTVYCLPGGNVDFEETLEACLVRELNEELGITVSLDKCILIAETATKNGNEFVLHHVYLAKTWSGTMALNSKETSANAYEWVALEKLETIALYPNVATDIIQQLRETQPMVKYLGVIPQMWY